MKIALVVVGRTRPSSEEKTLREIARKVIPREIGIESRLIARGDLLNNINKVTSCINEILFDHPDISKIIVCVDSHCTQIEENERKARKIEKDLKTKVGQPVFYVVIEHALEGWLLVDPESIIGYLGPRVKIDIPPSYAKECKPEEKMKEIFRKSDRQFIHMRDNRHIAERFDIDRAAKANKNFARFVRILKDP